MRNVYLKKGDLSGVFTTSLVIFGLLSFTAGMVYITGQQILRQSANDPQIQMSEDTASALAAGVNIQDVLPAGTVAMQTSLASYLMIFDDTGHLLSASTQLDGAAPVVPDGVFNDVRQKGKQRFSWQPASGVRSAAVITHFSGSASGFVLAGRSLREVEKREDQLFQLTILGWLTGCVVLGVLVVFRFFIFRKFGK